MVGDGGWGGGNFAVIRPVQIWPIFLNLIEAVNIRLHPAD